MAKKKKKKKEHGGKPKKVKEIADAIRRDNKGISDSVAYRMAWETYCSYSNPGHKGCTHKGKSKRKSPKPYSKSSFELALMIRKAQDNVINLKDRLEGLDVQIEDPNEGNPAELELAKEQAKQVLKDVFAKMREAYSGGIADYYASVDGNPHLSEEEKQEVKDYFKTELDYMTTGV